MEELARRVALGELSEQEAAAQLRVLYSPHPRELPKLLSDLHIEIARQKSEL